MIGPLNSRAAVHRVVLILGRLILGVGHGQFVVVGVVGPGRSGVDPIGRRDFSVSSIIDERRRVILGIDLLGHVAAKVVGCLTIRAVD